MMSPGATLSDLATASTNTLGLRDKQPAEASLPIYILCVSVCVCVLEKGGKKGDINRRVIGDDISAAFLFSFCLFSSSLLSTSSHKSHVHYYTNVYKNSHQVMNETTFFLLPQHVGDFGGQERREMGLQVGRESGSFTVHTQVNGKSRNSAKCLLHMHQSRLHTTYVCVKTYIFTTKIDKHPFLNK
jgi:hypothetical protein